MMIFSNRNLSENSHRGFSLIEPMIAMVVMAVGFMGAVKLYMSITTSARDANIRLEALKLLDSKVEDLKQFTVLETTAGEQAFQDIGNNTGGTLASGTYGNFNLSWCVNTSNCLGSAFNGNYYYANYNASASTTNTLNALLPSFKKVKVVVTWTDEDGVQKQLSNETVIPAKSIVKSGIVTSSADSLYVPPGPHAVSLPDGAVDNGNGQSTVTKNGHTYIFDNSSGSVLSIDGVTNVYQSIKGIITINSGNPAPATSNIDLVTVISSISCIYPYTAGSGVYACYYISPFTGTITIGNISTDHACPASYSFTNETSSLLNKNFLIKKNSC